MTAHMSDEELLAGTTDEKINRMLLLFRDGHAELKKELATANQKIENMTVNMMEKDKIIATLQESNKDLKLRMKNLEEKQDNEQVLSWPN